MKVFRLLRQVSHVLCWLVVLLGAFAGFLFWAYSVKSEGTLYLPRAHGTATITREEDTGIAHIYGETYNDAIYA